MAIRKTVVLIVVAAAARTGFAQIALTEKEAVERTLQRPALRQLQAGTLAAAAGDVTQARAFFNPTLGYERAPLQGLLAGERQTTYSLAQRFELGGKRGLRIDAADARLSASQADVEARRRGLAAEVRRRFHEALAMQLGSVALQDWERRLEDAEGVAQRLQKGGEAAGYDRRRVARERATAASRVKAAQADFARALDVLRAHTGTSDETALVLSGVVLPEEPAPLAAYLAGVDARPDLKALAARAEAFRHEEALSRRQRIPDVTLSAGLQQVDRSGLNDSGVIVGVSIPLPIFERGQGAGERAAGQAQAAMAERELAVTKAQGDVRGLWRQASLLRAAAGDFRREALDGSRRLAEIARAAYRGGEMGILELLDAHRSLVEAEMRALELEIAARGAVLDLELAAEGGRP